MSENTIDWHLFLETVGDDLELARDFIDAHFYETPNMITSMERAMVQQDSETAYRAAHTIKGTVGVFQAEATVATAKQLETVFQESQWDDAQVLLAQLKQQIDAVEHELKQQLAAAEDSAE